MTGSRNEARGYTTVSVSNQVHTRLERLKPFESMSFSELIDEMADNYEKQGSH